MSNSNKKKTNIAVLDINKETKLFLKPCKTRQELAAWIKHYLGLHLPDVTVSRYADTNPLQVIWEVYDICVNKNNPQKIQELLYVAGRGSGKTLGMAIAELMILIHDQRDVVHVGAILSQAKRCYEYQQKFLLSSKVKPIVSPSDKLESERILEKTNMEKSYFNIGLSKVTLEVLPCTLKATNGPHVPLVVVDEIDTVSGEGVRAYKEISGMLDSKAGKKALRVGISTRKSRYGLMNAAIENAPNEGRTVRKWTAFEFTERCPDTRSGNVETNYYVNQDKMEVLTSEEYGKKDKNKQKEYIHHKGFDGCGKCPLFSICLTDAKKQTSKSPMLKTLDELAQKVKSEGADWALAQLMNLKPSVEGIIFREYEEKIHVKTWNQMWYTLTGKEFPGECTHDMFVKKCHELSLPCYAGIDWGFSAPHTVVFFFMDKKENVYVVKCDGMTYISQPMWIHHIKTKYHTLYRCQLYVPDSADQGAILEMQKAGLPTANNQKDKGSVNTGIQVIKKLLKVPGTMDAKVFLARETCVPLMAEMTLYHYKLDAAGLVTDDPDSEHDHWIDALRYPLMFLLGKSQMILGTGLSFDSMDGLTDKMGNYVRMPSPVEFAATSGIAVNQNSEDVSKLGKIVTNKDVDDDGGDDPNNIGGGGFLWSF